MENLAEQLFHIGAIKFGDFTTKTGLYTPVYFDLRVIVSYPNLLELLADTMLSKIEENNLEYQLLCGVPYTALPIASILSIKSRKPMVMRRKEAKSYGTKKLVEGVFKEKETCLIIEDVVTSGSSILETVKDLKNSDLLCKDVLVLLNREQGGKDILNENGIRMHTLITISELMDILSKKGLILESTKMKVEEYVIKNKITASILDNPREDRLSLSYSARLNSAKNKVAQNLFSLMVKKKTNLCIAADLTNATDILNLAEEVGPYICCFKTHIDVVEDFHENFIKRLKEIAEMHEFVIMEDRKFADIGKTVQLQFEKGTFQISSWASLITVHSLFGKGVLDAIESVSANTGVFLLAEASTEGCLIDNKYTEESIKLALQYEALVAGIVCQNPLFRNHPGLLQLTPGVQITAKADGLGQTYNSPDEVVLHKGSDISVVGRGITQSKDRRTEAKKYRDLLWDAYERRIS